MNFQRFVVLLLFVCPLTAVAADDARPDIRQIFARWTEGYESKDLDKLMSIYTPDLKYSFQDQPDQNFDELKAQYVADFTTPHPKWKWSSFTETINVEGSFAVVVSRWTCREVSPLGASKVVMKIRSIDMLRRTAAGWKIFRTLNYPEQI